MFETLTEKFTAILGRLQGRTLTERNVEEACQAVRTALLEADVHFRVAREFVEHVRAKALGVQIVQGVEPAQQFVKIVYDELIGLLGEPEDQLFFAAKGPTVLMFAGLQGSGKTTTVAKMAHRLRAAGRRPLLVAADTQRPAAVEQLQILGRKLELPVFSAPELAPPEICRRAVAAALSGELSADTVLLDTAGRLAVDETLMQELEQVVAATRPHEIFLVVDAMTGQDAVNSAKSFNDRLEISGVILTKLDGDARGGAALSIRAVTGKPIKFVGVGEQLEALEPFNPPGMAERIIGMGDVNTLVRKMQSVVDQEQARKFQEKLQKKEFTLQDMLEQLRQVRKAGPVNDLMGMIPGMSGLLGGEQIDEKEIDRLQAIICSMTAEERRRPEIIDQSRRRRIAKGSGNPPEAVSGLVKQYFELRKLFSGKGRLAALFGGLFGQAGLSLPGVPGLSGAPGAAERGPSSREQRERRRAKKQERERRKRGRR